MPPIPMKKHDWFRQSSWTEQDKASFFERLNRSRGSSRAQYIRIQAFHLAEANIHDAAIELLNLLLEKYPGKLELASAHLQLAHSFAALQNHEASLEHFRLALKAEENIPQVQTNAWLDFPWYVITRKMSKYYEEVKDIIEQHERSTLFPIQEYRLAAIQAIIADEHGQHDEARKTGYNCSLCR